jgi:hypothetical protein
MVGGKVHTVGVGTCTVNADQAGDDLYLAAKPLTRTFSVAKAATVLTIAPARRGPQTFSATLRRADTGAPIAGQVITFRVGPNKMCAATTNSAGVASCGRGSANYSATYAGSATYLAATANKRW